MGVLVYAGALRHEIDDRALAHLEAAIVTKLRHQESFMLSWTLRPEQGSGRISLWISPAIPLQLEYSGSRRPTLNRDWVEAMVRLSSSARGLILIPESEVVEGRAAGPAQARRSVRARGRA